jgi:hypothetical protein
MAESKGLFSWRAPKTRLKFIESYINSRIPEFELQELLLRIQTDEYRFSDQYKEDFDYSIETEYSWIFEDLADEFECWHIRAYHGGRPVIPENYLEYGIQRLKRIEQRSELQAYLMAKHEMPKIEFDRMYRAYETRSTEPVDTQQASLCYCVLDVVSMLEEYGHYLIYGSEYWQWILTHNFRHLLRDRGRPTIAELTVPLSKVDVEVREQLATVLFFDWLRNQANNKTRIPNLNFGLCFPHDIPKSWVKRIWHPKKIRHQSNDVQRYYPESNTFRTDRRRRRRWPNNTVTPPP